MSNLEDIKSNKILSKKEDKAYNIKKYKEMKEFLEELNENINVNKYKYNTCAWFDYEPNLFREKSWKDLTKDKKQYNHNE